MNKLTQKIAVGLGTGALLAATLTPTAFADTSITIRGNGSHSDNDVSVEQSSSFHVSQNNFAEISNDIMAEARTGGNSANDNTGGSVHVRSGSSHISVDIMNHVNTNIIGFWRWMCGWDN